MKNKEVNIEFVIDIFISYIVKSHLSKAGQIVDFLYSIKLRYI